MTDGAGAGSTLLSSLRFIASRGASWERLRDVPPWRPLFVEVQSFARWRDPGEQARVDGLLSTLFLDIEAWTRQLQGVEWAVVPDDPLVALVEAGLAVDVGIRALVREDALPPDVMAEELELLGVVRLLDTLLKWGLMAFERDEVADALDLAREALAARLAGQPAWQEMVRRLDTHKPGQAAVLSNWADALRRDGIGGRARDEMQDRALEYLRRRVRNKFSRTAVRDGGEHPDLLGQAWETISKRWGAGDPLVEIGEALKGQRNVAPWAIRDDLDNLQSSEAPERRFQVDFVTPASESPDDRARVLEVLQKHRRLVEAGLESELTTRKALGEALKLSPRQVHTLFARLRADLKGP